MQLIGELDERHGIGERLRFIEGPGGLTTARVETDASIGEITLHGAQVISWIPTGHEPVLWMSETSHFRRDREIRGGIPVCWPWFGVHQHDAQQPIHGFVRMASFEVVRSFETPEGECGIEFLLRDSPHSRAHWPDAFSLRLVATFGSALDLRLIMHNTSPKPATYGAGLHTYLRVGDVERLDIEGLANTDYLDKIEDFARSRQREAPRIDGVIDRVYLDTEAACTVHDPVLARRLRIAKQGSRTTVLWNPGPEIARAMEDLDDEGFRNMMCLESVNAFDDQVTLQPDARHTLGTRIEVERI